MNILFTSDLHLGDITEELGISAWDRLHTFRKITALALEHDLLLIGGDLFSGEPDEPTIQAVHSELEKLRLRGILTIFIPGEADLGSNGQPFESITSLPFTRLCTKHGEVHQFEIKDEKIILYASPASDTQDLTHLNRTENEGFHCGLFYIPFESPEEEPSNSHISRRDMKRLNLDFYALGSYHSFRVFKVHDRIIGAYPGSPECTNMQETGDRYVISFTVEDNEIAQIKRLAVNSRRLERIELDCSLFSDEEELAAQIPGRESERQIYLVKLQGTRNFPLSSRVLDAPSQNLLDMSEPELPVLIQEHRDDPRLKGHLFRILEKKLKTGNTHDELTDDSIYRLFLSLSRGSESLTGEWPCI